MWLSRMLEGMRGSHAYLAAEAEVSGPVPDKKGVRLPHHARRRSDTRPFRCLSCACFESCDHATDIKGHEATEFESEFRLREARKAGRLAGPRVR